MRFSVGDVEVSAQLVVPRIRQKARQEHRNTPGQFRLAEHKETLHAACDYSACRAALFCNYAYMKSHGLKKLILPVIPVGVSLKAHTHTHTANPHVPASFPNANETVHCSCKCMKKSSHLKLSRQQIFSCGSAYTAHRHGMARSKPRLS